MNKSKNDYSFQSDYSTFIFDDENDLENDLENDSKKNDIQINGNNFDFMSDKLLNNILDDKDSYSASSRLMNTDTNTNKNTNTNTNDKKENDLNIFFNDDKLLSSSDQKNYSSSLPSIKQLKKSLGYLNDYKKKVNNFDSPLVFKSFSDQKKTKENKKDKKDKDDKKDDENNNENNNENDSKENNNENDSKENNIKDNYKNNKTDKQKDHSVSKKLKKSIEKKSIEILMELVEFKVLLKQFKIDIKHNVSESKKSIDNYLNENYRKDGFGIDSLFEFENSMRNFRFKVQMNSLNLIKNSCKQHLKNQILLILNRLQIFQHKLFENSKKKQSLNQKLKRFIKNYRKYINEFMKRIDQKINIIIHLFEKNEYYYQQINSSILSNRSMNGNDLSFSSMNNELNNVSIDDLEREERMENSMMNDYLDESFKMIDITKNIYNEIIKNVLKVIKKLKHEINDIFNLFNQSYDY